MLGDEGDVFAHIVQGCGPHVHAIHKHGAGTDVVKPGQKAGEGGFPRSAGPHEPHHLTGADVDINAVQHMAGPVVGEGNMIVVQPARRTPQRNGVGRLRHGVRLFQNVVDALQGGVRAFQVGEGDAQALERVIAHEQSRGQGRKFGFGHAHFISLHQQDAQAQSRHDFQDRHQEMPVFYRPEVDLKEPLDQPQE